jgi:tRNA pseudouridine55 synthase
MVKKALGTGKVGHAGTLDKFAEGLLIVLTGRCTKLIPWFLNCDKCYTGIVKFGVETETLDPEGEIVKECAIPSRKKIEAAIPQFIGNIMQAPPAYSSIHIDGKRAYQLAREGADVEMKTRPIEIYDFQLEKYENGEGTIKVVCSKGTYIRSLARDLAHAADSCAHLVYLNRTSIAGFLLEQAVNPSTENDPHESIRNAVKPVDTSMFDLLNIPHISVDDKTADSLINGRPLNQIININIKGTVPNLAIFRQDGSFVGIIERKNDSWKYGYMYANN